MLPPTAGIAQDQRDRPEMAYQQRRDVRELTREIIRDAARAANRQQSISPGGKPVKTTPRYGHACQIDIRQHDI